MLLKGQVLSYSSTLNLTFFPVSCRLFQLGCIMEISSFRSVAELGMDDALFSHQWPVNPLEGLSSESIASLICESELSQLAGANRPLKQLKTTTWDSCKPGNMSNSHSSSSVHLLNSNFTEMLKPIEESWSSSNTPNLIPSEFIVSQASLGNQDFILQPCQGPKGISMNTRQTQAKDHILAERIRREKLSQRFIALSALIPGLKRMDKASVLGDAIKYMKHLQEKVKILEEQTKTRSMESLVFVRKYELYADGENASSDEISFSSGPIISEPLPKIEARFCNKDVLIIIHCEKRKGILEKAVAEIEKLHLSVVNSCVMTFGDSTVNITIIAQKDEDFTMNMKEMVKNLRCALEIFM